LIKNWLQINADLWKLSPPVGERTRELKIGRIIGTCLVNSDIRTLWALTLSPERQSARISEIKNVG